MANDVSTRIAEYDAMIEEWELVKALMGGTKAMRAAGPTYMPRFPLECPESYQARLKRATLYAAYSETVKNSTGHVFASPVVLSDDVPEVIAEQAKNIDLDNHSLTVFAANWFECGLAFGLAHVLVDFPRVSGARTLADEKAVGARPYCTLIHPRQVISWVEEKIDGVPALTEARIVEEIKAPDGQFGVKTIKQIRVLRRGSFQVWRQSGEKGDWVVVEDGVMSLARIPLVTFYTGRTGFMTAEPPLREVAHLNVKHWQEQSDQDTSVRFARVRLLWTAGADPVVGDDGKEKPLQSSADSIISLPSGAAMGVVQGSAESTGIGQNALDALERQMQEMGAKVRRKDAQFSKTTRQAADDSVSEKSALGRMAQDMEDCIDQVLQLMADWQNLGDGGSCEVNDDFDMDMTPDQSMETLIALNAAGVISDQTLFNESKRRGLVSDSVTWEDEQHRIQTAPPRLI